MNNRKATVVDYDMGNLFSIEKAIDYVGGIADITGDPARIAKADRLVLPGVGAFGSAKQRLEEKGIADAINEFARTQRPLLGICLGMQLLFSEGHEFGHHEGLGLIEGKVVRFKDPNPEGPRFKIPQIGWTEIELPELNKISTDTEWNRTILQGIDPGSFFYFVHSYICVPGHKQDVLAESVYGDDRFCSVVWKDHIGGCQFHPEKSDNAGLLIYENLIHL